MFSATTTTFFVKLPKTGVPLVLASCLPCLCLFGYDTQRYNIIIIKQFLKSFFLRNTCIPCSLPSTTRPETQSFCSYFNFFGMLPVLLCQIGPLSMDQLLFRHHKSMTHDSKRVRDAAFFLIIMLVTFAATLLKPQKYVSSRTIQKCVEHVSTST